MESLMLSPKTPSWLNFSFSLSQKWNLKAVNQEVPGRHREAICLADPRPP